MWSDEAARTHVELCVEGRDSLNIIKGLPIPNIMHFDIDAQHQTKGQGARREVFTKFYQ